MTEVFCLDAAVWVKWLTPEEFSDVAATLVLDSAVHRRVAPAFCWAEVGSTLRKKADAGSISHERAEDAWQLFIETPISFIDSRRLRARAWQLAREFAQPTLYDAAYLACTEVVDAEVRSFWTTDDVLLQSLGDRRPPYVRHLREVAAG